MADPELEKIANDALEAMKRRYQRLSSEDDEDIAERSFLDSTEASGNCMVFLAQLKRLGFGLDEIIDFVRRVWEVQETNLKATKEKALAESAER